MSRDKSVVFAFPRAWEPGDASQHAKPVESFPAPGKDLVRITLVSHVPDKFIAGCSKHLMQRNRQFNGTEIGGKMPSGFGDGVNQKRADLRAQLLQLSEIQPFDVGWGMDRV